MNSGLTDTHCHLYFQVFREDLEQVLARAWDQGVERILIPGIDLDSSRQAVVLAEQHPNLFAAVGIHPNDALTWGEWTLTSLRELASHPKTVAIGEIGLDYYRDRAPKETQIQIFRTQLALAKECGKPVVIHDRQAIHDVWPILEAWQADLAVCGSPLAYRPGVLHSFDEPLSWARKVVEKWFFLGITGPVTFKKAIDKQELAAGIPLEHLLLETDAPFLTPHPHRGRRNEPAYTAFIADKIAALKEIPVESVRSATNRNAAKLFAW
jgi:TatD DNase family protein